jgi:hypothetical protein
MKKNITLIAVIALIGAIAMGCTPKEEGNTGGDPQTKTMNTPETK